MKHNFNTQRSSYTFLFEMLWVCGFFAICAGIFALLFVKADELSRKANDLTYAITLSQNTMETLFSQSPLPTSTYYTKDWEPTSNKGSNAYAKVETTSEVKNQFMTITVQVIKIKDNSLIYELSGSHSLLLSTQEGDAS